MEPIISISNNVLCPLLSNIQWGWFILAVVVTYIIGACWYSLLFSKLWLRIFKVEMPDEMKKSSFLSTMLIQLLASAFFGLGLFLLVKISVWLAVFLLLGFCGWQKASLKFRYAKWKQFFQAALIEAGYTFIAGIVYILFGLI